MIALGLIGERIGSAARAVKHCAPLPRLAIGLFGALALTGCAVGGNAIDRSVSTNAISMAEPAASIAVDPFAAERPDDPGEADRLIDEDTIRLAVTTTDLDKLPGGALPWASAATGSSGTVTDIIQTESVGQTCRQFSASRNAYDGVTIYRGEVCLDPRSGWWTRSLAPLGESGAAG